MKILLSLLSLIFICSCRTNTMSKNPQDKTSYFPQENVFSESFSYELRQLNEPKISNLNNKNIEIYRMTSVGEIAGEASVTELVRQGDKILLYTIHKKFRNVKRKKRKVSFEVFNKFKEDLKKFDLENFSTYLENPVDDGIRYCLEINDKGNYKVIFRNNPQTGRNSDPKFLEITDLFYKLKK